VTLRLQDILPTGQFACCLDISPARPNTRHNFDNSTTFTVR